METLVRGQVVATTDPKLDPLSIAMAFLNPEPHAPQKDTWSMLLSPASTFKSHTYSHPPWGLHPCLPCTRNLSILAFLWLLGSHPLTPDDPGQLALSVHPAWFG